MGRRKFMFDCLVVVLLKISISVCDTIGDANVVDHKSWVNVTESKWISQLLSEGKRTFDMDVTVNGKCKRDFDLYKLHLRNQSVWALRISINQNSENSTSRSHPPILEAYSFYDPFHEVMESSEWPSTGIFAGITRRLGNWQECLLVSKYDVAGKYCLVNFYYETNQHRVHHNSLQWPDEGTSVWDVIESYKPKPWIISRQHLSWALCIPASCQPIDVENSLNRTLHPIFKAQGLNINVDVNPAKCTIRQQREYTLGFYLVCGFLGMMIGVILLCTIFDKAGEDESNSKSVDRRNLWYHLCKSVSIIQNCKNLVRTTSSQSSTVYLVKLIYMICIVHGHRSIFSLGYPNFNPEWIEMGSYSSKNAGMSLRGLMVVDVFFMISGFLTFHFGYNLTRKLGLIYVVQSIIVRWARMVLVFVVIMLIIIHVLPFLGNGPMWNHRVGVEVENCKFTFWDNFLGISNLIHADRMCLYTSWYISVDLQLTVIGSLLLLITVKRQKFGIFLIVLVFLVGNVITFFISYINQFHAVLPAYMSFLEEPRNSKEFTENYVSPYTRIAPYILGCLTALLTKKINEKQLKISNMTITIFLILHIASKILILTYVERLFDFINEYDRLDHAINAALIRWVFVSPECVTLLVSFTSNLGAWNKAFDLKLWVPIGRLLYCVFVTHMVLQLYTAASNQVLVPSYSFLPQFWIIVPDVFYSFVAAFLLHLLVEAPVSNLCKVLMMIIFSTQLQKHVQTFPCNDKASIHTDDSAKNSTSTKL